MKNKKVSIREFKQVLTRIVKEEVQNVLQENLDSAIKKVVDKREMARWVMRQWFKPEKHASKIWFDPEVTVDDVLIYVSDSKNNFPLSPKQLVEMWKDKKYLGAAMKSFVDKPEDEEDEDKVKYQTGEVTLKDIGQELGGLTPTMINKLASAGMEKIKKITHGTAPWEMESDKWTVLMKAIKQARLDSAKEYVEKLKSSETVNEFLETLRKEHILTSNDIQLVQEKEVEGLTQLKSLPGEQITQVLLDDIESADNIFKSFQSAVSKKVFPPAKRGRPRKNID